ncbi:MAG: UDP-N-acetylmuramoyl-L-alanyl-D-glutamate--2,6-diaminopimelate ligase [Bacteroidales bacterium]|nr:UDP-N-acetylmuramoyl-L-alanyl-D-glutamate--2,6-diaminopimelate ligase [Bacteroidales bacterium]
MKDIRSILQQINTLEVRGEFANPKVNKIFIDSKKVKPNSLFIAIKGTTTDGHDFIDDAIVNGARFIVCERIPFDTRSDVLYIKVENTRKIAGIIASIYYDHPSTKLKVIGVTGTNGKTTVATLLYRLHRLMGKKCGLISTVVNYADSKLFPATHTTPNPVELQRLLGKMVEARCEYCFMEVSSHAVDQHRIEGIKFHGAIFTNITHDHLDYHKTFENYLQAKKAFFDHLPETAFALTNIDDKNGRIMVQNTKAKIYTYALKTLADFHVKIIEKHLNGTLLQFDKTEVFVNLIGEFNVYNLLAIYGTSILLGFSKEEVLLYLSMLKPVDGRFEYFVSKEGSTIIVDYAHTPDAITKVLSTINDIKKESSHIITVIGAGGNRDKTKRPLMAAEAARYSQKLILTSDNPRYEDPEEIIADMKKGLDNDELKKTLTIVDRKEAIRTAIQLAKKDDIVLIAGKGHENYQEIKGVKYPFDDRLVVKETIK